MPCVDPQALALAEADLRAAVLLSGLIDTAAGTRFSRVTITAGSGLHDPNLGWQVFAKAESKGHALWGGDRDAQLSAGRVQP
ncbi:MAG: hypothetical protein AAGI50_04600 [Pseudomonadota bacterium]